MVWVAWQLRIDDEQRSEVVSSESALKIHKKMLLRGIGGVSLRSFI